MRIDVDLKPGNLAPNAHPAVKTGTYRVPADNPFVGATSFNGLPDRSHQGPHRVLGGGVPQPLAVQLRRPSPVGCTWVTSGRATARRSTSSRRARTTAGRSGRERSRPASCRRRGPSPPTPSSITAGRTAGRSSAAGLSRQPPARAVRRVHLRRLRQRRPLGPAGQRSLHRAEAGEGRGPGLVRGGSAQRRRADRLHPEPRRQAAGAAADPGGDRQPGGQRHRHQQPAGGRRRHRQQRPVVDPEQLPGGRDGVRGPQPSRSPACPPVRCCSARPGSARPPTRSTTPARRWRRSPRAAASSTWPSTTATTPAPAPPGWTPATSTRASTSPSPRGPPLVAYSVYRKPVTAGSTVALPRIGFGRRALLPGHRPVAPPSVSHGL